jgi:8-amino-7-oxononanoate synthase
MQMNYGEHFQEKLLNLKAKNLYRQPKKNHPKLLNFCSNDYLGLSKNRQVKNAAISAIKKYSIGAKASRYVFSDNPLAEKLEKKLADMKNCQAAIVLGSGYLSSIGVISAIMEEGDLIIADRLIHSSLIDGCKLSGAKLMRFKHNDIAHCEELLKKYFTAEVKKCLIITETVFSMDGDIGKVEELLELAKKYNCLLLTDDAHGLGILKKTYPKYEMHLQCGTFSKAAGSYGGYICGSNLMIDYLRNFTKTAIYSTALPPAILAANLKALEIIDKDKKLGKKALENAGYFCELLELPKPSSAIVPIIIGDAKKTLEISEKLKEQGFLISAIRPPTVEVGKARLRVTFCADHKKSDIKKLAALLRLEFLEFTKD